MLELLLLLGIILFCIIQQSEHNILFLFIPVLTFHTLLKSLFSFFYGGGDVFSYWKEIVVLIFAFKVFSKPHLKPNKKVFISQICFICFVLFFFFISDIRKEALPTLRNHLFPVILFSAISIMKLDASFLKKILNIFIGVITFANILGLIQYFFLNLPISLIMGQIDLIDTSGNIQYSTSSFRILGYERMGGVLGGPNIFGLFNGFAIVFLFGIIINKNNFNIGKNKIILIKSVLFLSIVCILFSFSRAGWFVAIIGIVILLKPKGLLIKFKYFLITAVFILIAIVIISANFPYVIDVVTDSFTGKEESAAGRSDSVLEALEINIVEPLGHGLGTTDNRTDKMLYFAESAFMNIAFEIGILGLLLLFIIQFFILKIINDNCRISFIPQIVKAISITTIIVCFFSISPYAMPYIYIWWLFLGIGINPSVNSFGKFHSIQYPIRSVSSNYLKVMHN